MGPVEAAAILQQFHDNADLGVPLPSQASVAEAFRIADVALLTQAALAETAERDHLWLPRMLPEVALTPPLHKAWGVLINQRVDLASWLVRQAPPKVVSILFATALEANGHPIA